MENFNVEELLETARKRTGLSDFGPPDFLEGLTVLVDGINTESELRPGGREHMHERLQRMLMNRLWFAKDLTEHPDILHEDLGSPVIIASLPRTGSTKLHRLLGASQGFQTLPWWKAHMFSRIPGLVNGGQARRIQETREFEKWMYEVSPGMLTGHPMFTDEPEEDQWLMEASFRHPLAYAMVGSLKYVQWVMQTDMQPTFDYYLMQLKYLQWQSREQLGRPLVEPWLLKTPNHMGNEPLMSRLFEKPRFIITHRDPAKCIPSGASTGLAMRNMYSDTKDITGFGAGVVNLFSNSANQHVAWRESKPDVEILDLGFREITEDGLGTARKVYQFLGMPFTPEAERGVLEWERNNPKDKHGKGKYSAADIGMTDDEIRKIFAPYMQRFSAYL